MQFSQEAVHALGDKQSGLVTVLEKAGVEEIINLNVLKEAMQVDGHVPLEIWPRRSDNLCGSLNGAVDVPSDPSPALLEICSA